MDRHKTRGIVEGAIINGIFVILLILAMYTPLSYILLFFLPVPYVIYAQRHDLKPVLLTSLASLALSFMIGGFPFLLAAPVIIIPGMVMGIAYRKNITAWKVLARGTVAFVAANIFTLAVFKYLFHMNIPGMMLDFLDEVNKMAQNNIDTLINTMPPGQSPESLQQLESMKEAVNQNFMLMKEMANTLLPSFVLVISFLQAFVSHVICRRVLKRLGVAVKALPAFQELHMPRWILYYYFILFVILLIPDIKNYLFLYNVAMNGTFLLSTLVTVLGVAVAAKYWATRGWNRGLFIVLALILLFFTPFHLFFLYLGIIELLFNIRKRFSEK